MDLIVKGCDWSADLTVGPGANETNDDVVTQLTGATVTAALRWRGGLQATTPTASVQSASNRIVRVTFTAAQTAQLAVRQDYRLDLRVTTSAAKTYPIEVLETVRVIDGF